MMENNPFMKNNPFEILAKPVCFAERKKIEGLEAQAEIGKAFVWALQEGLIGNIAIEPLVKKYREAVSERKE